MGKNCIKTFLRKNFKVHNKTYVDGLGFFFAYVYILTFMVYGIRQGLDSQRKLCGVLGKILNFSQSVFPFIKLGHCET